MVKSANFAKKVGFRTVFFIFFVEGVAGTRCTPCSPPLHVQKNVVYCIAVSGRSSPTDLARVPDACTTQLVGWVDRAKADLGCSLCMGVRTPTPPRQCFRIATGGRFGWGGLDMRWGGKGQPEISSFFGRKLCPTSFWPVHLLQTSLGGNVCLADARRATFVLSILSLAPSLSPPREVPQVDHSRPQTLLNVCPMPPVHVIVRLLAGCQSAILSSNEWHNDHGITKYGVLGGLDVQIVALHAHCA